MRDQGTEKFEKVLRFMFSVPTPVQERLKTLIAVTKKIYSCKTVFHTRPNVEREGVKELKKTVEDFIMCNCTELTIGKFCANWFVLPQFRVTCMKAWLMILSRDTAR